MQIHFELITQCLFLVAIANGAPILASSIFGDAFSQPLDCGLKLPDGRPLFGSSKTLRGIVAALAATALLAPAIGMSWTAGFAIAALAMAGDLCSSFAKRRMGLEPSSRCTGVDQVPESLIPAIAGIPLLGLSVCDAVLVAVLFFAGTVILSYFLFRLNIRKTPY